MTFRFTAGSTPLLVSMPHLGTAIPDDIAAGMTAAGREVPDTDWHLDRLYDFAGGLGAGLIMPIHSRYVIDLNRPPDGAALYPGASNTELCPLTRFDDQPIYLDGRAPDAAEVARRRDAYWRPYHQQIASELARLRALFGIAVLFDAHSIRSVVPRFFEGRLPDLNLGFGSGQTAAPELIDRLSRIAMAATGYSHAIDGRFKGGYITRSYGRPAEGVHAFQLELSQITYMEEAAPFGYRADVAERVRPTLRALVEAMLDWSQSQTRGGAAS
jgi:N-formylglutamate deformylase